MASGMYKALKLEYRPNATKVCVLIADAPPHGMRLLVCVFMFFVRVRVREYVSVLVVCLAHLCACLRRVCLLVCVLCTCMHT